jgi:hypothetical protein
MKGLIEVENNVLKNGIHYVTSDYKTRNTKRPTHGGMDMVSYNGKNTTTDYIVCVSDGEVVKSTYSPLGGGYWVEVKHPNNISSRYLHMKKGSIQVKVGEKIEKGQVIGYMGNTGNSHGAHLDFRILVNGKITDPYPYLLDDSLFVNTEYTPGLYVTHYNLYVRTGPGTNYEPKKVKDLTKNGKKNATSKDPNADAVYKEGTRFDVLEIKMNKTQIWGRGYSGWVCLKGKVDYCTKIK